MPLHQNRKHTEQGISDSQRLTTEELRTVVAIWGRQKEMPERPTPDRPTLADVAEALNIEAGQAKKLLEQARSETLVRSHGRRLKLWVKASAVAVALSVASITVGCETFAGFATYGKHIYRPIPPAQWGFGTAYYAGSTYHRYGFISVQDGQDGGAINEIHFFYYPGGDPFP